MAAGYSVEVCKKLEEKFISAGLHRPQKIVRYDEGQKLVYSVKGIEQSDTATVHLVIEKFVGGGFAGQVYQVKLIKIEGGQVASLEQGGKYAMKILLPPSNSARLFRNALYWIGFQGPFQLQVNPAAARSGALWQKFIRRGAKNRFGDERAVVDIYATFVDKQVGSCGELSEWIEGRTWQLEVDDRMDYLKLWRHSGNVNQLQPGSPEYRSKRHFMTDFVKLLHDMGAYEFSRQYEWSTCKSQPNCLKRREDNEGPTAGLVAVDFRAGLTLLPFLPMSPGDFKLIWQGLKRGSLVQFDRGSLEKLEVFVDSHGDEFSDMRGMLEELKEVEQIYRNSIPDIAHNHICLLYSKRLWLTMLDSAVTSWGTRGLVDEKWEQKLRNNKILTLLFFVVGLIPFLGKVIRRLWAKSDWRRHYIEMLTSVAYFKRSIQGKISEKMIVWYRTGRVDEERALKMPESFLHFLCHLPFTILPACLHRFLTDGKYAKQRLVYFFVRPVRLYFNANLREQWLKDMVAEGRKKHMVSNEDAEIILSQTKEPFIQKYLKSLAVHICTLPVTQIVSVTIAILYVITHPEMPWEKSWGTGAFIIGAFQVTPISPGSLVRGFYVLYLVLRERDFKNYNIAVFLGFFKYIGYLAFPIQMTYHYPALSRFMASHWATEAVHIVPVFGERGALLEHWVFRLFYNWPLTIRRRMRRRAEIRSKEKSRYWHTVFISLAAGFIFGLTDFIFFERFGRLPGLLNIWYLTIVLPFICGIAVTLRAGGAVLWKRIVAACCCGIAAGVFYTVITFMIGFDEGAITAADLVRSCIWRVFIFAILSTVGAIVTELKLPDPDLR